MKSKRRKKDNNLIRSTQSKIPNNNNKILQPKEQM